MCISLTFLSGIVKVIIWNNRSFKEWGKNMEQVIRLISTGFRDNDIKQTWGPGMRQHYIIHYVLSGEGYFKVNGKLYEIKENESFIICPYTVVQYYANKENPWSYTWVNFESHETGIEAFGFQKGNPVRKVAMTEMMTKYFSRLQELDVWNRNKNEAVGILYSILGLLQDENTLLKTADDERLEKAAWMIAANYHRQEFGVELLCELLDMNRVTLFRLFKQKWNISPCQYIINYRIEQASRLLAMGNNVTTTAISCGFSDPLYFSKVYKKKTGHSPSKR